MSIFTILAAAAATFLAGPEIRLDPDDLEGFGIEFSVLDMEREFRHPYPLFIIEVGLNGFSECDVRSVSLDVFNEQGQQVFGTSVAEESGIYRFNIQEQYLTAAVLGIICDAGPDELDPTYIIELWNYRRAP